MVVPVEIEVFCEEQQVKLPLLVFKGEGRSLFGQDWLTKKFSVELGLGILQGYVGKTHVDPGAQLKYCKARSVKISTSLLIYTP